MTEEMLSKRPDSMRPIFFLLEFLDLILEDHYRFSNQYFVQVEMVATGSSVASS